MNNINIGNKIRELRKKKGITQEALASALTVTPQAVSKWESGLSYPEITMIPVIAGYFQVSLDMLFDYDVREMNERIDNIISEACKFRFSDTKKCAEMIKVGLVEYPENEALLSALLSAYEYDLRTNGCNEHINEMIEISHKIINESNDFIRVCSVKDDLAAAYLEKNEYAKAKEILETLPADINLKWDTMAFRLSGKDKLDAATWKRCDHLQSLYQACLQEGDAFFRLNDHGVKLRDYAPEEYHREAIKCYRKGLTVLTTFLIEGETGQNQYLWDGMQTFHWIFHQRIAACHKVYGEKEECEKELDKAYEIVTTAWNDFEECREEIMRFYNEYLCEYGLEEYKR